MNGSKKFYFHTHNITYRVNNRTEIRRVLERLFQNEKKNPEQIDFIICDDEYLLDLNKAHLKHDYYTDVITFDYTTEEINEGVVGEVYISIQRVRDNATKFKVNTTTELHRVMIHGALHLCGYKDHTAVARTRMTAKEDYYLSLF